MARKQQGKWTKDKSMVYHLGFGGSKRQNGSINVTVNCVFNFYNFFIPLHYKLLRECSIRKWHCIHVGNFLLCRLLILMAGFCPLLVEYTMVNIYYNSYTWELSPHLYFLAAGQQPHDPLTQLLIINKTGKMVDTWFPNTFTIQSST